MQRFVKEGQLVRKYREDNGITQMEAAKHLGYSTPQFISNIERGLAGIPAKEAPQLCDFLGLPYEKWVNVRVKSYREYLMGGL